ncbi:MAG: flagellar biosynthetic protein FliO [Pseudomonadota bacterium]
MDILVYFRALAALGLVLALIWGGVWLLRRYGSGLMQPPGAPKADRQLTILEQMSLPQRKTLVRVRNGSEEHLLVLSQSSELLISSTKAPTDA